MNECNSLTIVPVASVAIKVTFQMSMNKDIICTIKKQVHWTNHAVLTCGYITLRKKIKINSILKTWISRVYWPWLSEISIISSILFQSSVFFFLSSVKCAAFFKKLSLFSDNLIVYYCRNDWTGTYFICPLL